MTLDSLYLPNIEYFVLLNKFENVQIEIFENYQKQTYRNRCKILTANKIDDLIIPINKSKHNEIIKNIKLDYTQEWTRRHLGAIKAAYGKAAYFEYIFGYFSASFHKKHDFLIDFNFELLTTCLKILKIKKSISFTENYVVNVNDDFRGIISPKKDYAIQNIYFPSCYTQNFGNKFAPNLSIIDALMCHGPQTLQIIESSTVK
jgi:WbqC-like protein family